MREELIERFREAFGQAPAVVARAPGRLEILGNHTDYNEGFVISCATGQSTWFAAGLAPGPQAEVLTLSDGTQRSFDPRDVGAPVPGDWANYVKGVVRELVGRGVRVPPFRAVIGSTVPLSAGMSSSAALEVSCAYALGHLADVSFDPNDWARIGQAAENHYVGANTGLLDQFSSIHGQANRFVFCDFRHLTVETVAVPQGAVFVVADSGVKHNLTHEYNERRERCQAAAEFFAARLPGVSTLRDVNPSQLAEAKADLDDLTWRRAAHIVGEDDRVQRGKAALRAQDLPTLGALLWESHESSRRYFENSCPELDLLVDLSHDLGAYGARLSGGGFGGISIHLVAEAVAETYRQRLAAAFEARLGRPCTTRLSTIGPGAEIHV